MRGVAAVGSLLALLAGAVGCAHVESPPGGPEDRTPPQLLNTRPDSLAVVRDLSSPVVLVFDERISERGLDDLVMVSPRTSPVRIDHRRDQLRVSLREGWRPGIIYHVTVLPDLQDLFGNRRRAPLTFVFSTGPEIPETHARGTVVDRITGRPEVGIRVEAIRSADSLVYATPTDSAGAFRFQRIPTGEYRIRAYQDQNRNRALDEFEPRDSAAAMIAVGDTSELALGILLPDTTPPAITAVQVRGREIEVEFDDHLDPAQDLDPARFVVMDPAGRNLPVSSVGFASLPAVDTAEAVAAPADTARSGLPSRSVFLRMGEDDPLVADVEYTVIIYGIRNVNGLSADVQRTFSVEAVPEPEGEVPETGGAP